MGAGDYGFSLEALEERLREYIRRMEADAKAEAARKLEEELAQRAYAELQKERSTRVREGGVYDYDPKAGF